MGEGLESVVSRLTMLVTGDGQWVVEGSSDFFEALGDPAPDYDASLFAVKNLGFIKFQVLENSIIEVELHPHTVELPALLAVQQHLRSSRCKLFRIKHFDTEWCSEITSSAEHAILRLSELCAPAFSPPPSDRFVVEPQNITALLNDRQSNLRILAQKWNMSFGYFDPSVISFAISHRLLSRLVIVGVKPRAPEPRFRFIGDGHANWLEREYHFQIIGEKMQNLPDKDYGNWLAEFYKDVARTGVPRYDRVTAAIQQPEGAYRTRYERLLLPWRTESEEILVTLSSRHFDEDMEIPTPAFESASSSERNSAKSS